MRNDPGSCDVSGPADAAACRACSARCTANTCHIDRYIVITAQHRAPWQHSLNTILDRNSRKNSFENLFSIIDQVCLGTTK